ncbi:hypothetical protein MTO96_008112 [Rhipicephalus appendiculatus]
MRRDITAAHRRLARAHRPQLYEESLYTPPVATSPACRTAFDGVREDEPKLASLNVWSLQSHVADLKHNELLRGDHVDMRYGDVEQPHADRRSKTLAQP